MREWLPVIVAFTVMLGGILVAFGRMIERFFDRLDTRLPTSQYQQRHNELIEEVRDLRRIIERFERWAIRLNGKVPVSYSDMIPPDER